MNDWYSNIYKALIVSSAISFIIGFFSSGKVSLDAYITGYSVLLLSIMMILMVIFKGIFKINKDTGTFQLIYTILMSTGPFLLMLSVIGYVLFLIIKYKSLIVDEKVSTSFYSFSNVMIALLIIQLYLIYTNITTQKFQETGKISNLVISFLYLIGVLSGITSIILFTILDKFTTDGFQTF